MSALQDVIRCAPFRLPQPRPLTPFEWSVVRQAILDGFAAAQKLTLPGQPEVEALVQAIRNQTACPAWTTSSFGPAPAVAPYAYECLGAWYAQLDPASKARALSDIAFQGLLCHPQPPWAACPTSKSLLGRTAGDLWEGAPQRGQLFTGAEVCAWPRQRTAYVPMTGREMLALFRLAGGQVPPEFKAAEQVGEPFLDRTFLVGIMARPPGPIPGGSDLMSVVHGLTEEIAVIWAPGRGASLMFLLDQPIDSARISALLATMLPDLLPELIPGVQGWLPGLLPKPDDPIWQTIFGTLGQILPQSAQLQGLGWFGAVPSAGSQPGTRPNTGVAIVDRRGDELSTAPPPIEGLQPTGAKGVLITVAAFAIVAGTIGLLMSAAKD